MLNEPVNVGIQRFPVALSHEVNINVGTAEPFEGQ